MPKYSEVLMVLTMSNLAYEIEERLKKLGQILRNINRKDMTSTMGQLSLEFYRHAALAEGSVSSNEIGRAEGHRLIAQSIHETLKTLEVKRRILVKPTSTMNGDVIER
jgi:hypothetical protein